MSINRRDALVGAMLEQLGCDHLLYSQDDAIFAADADRGAAVLDRLDGVFDLEVAAVGGEDGVCEIVARSYRRLLFAGDRMLENVMDGGGCLAPPAGNIQTYHDECCLMG